MKKIIFILLFCNLTYAAQPMEKHKTSASFRENEKIAYCAFFLMEETLLYNHNKKVDIGLDKIIIDMRSNYGKIKEK